jgi:hypothetical protein
MMNVYSNGDNHKVERSSPEELISGYATKLILEGSCQTQVELICQRLNEDLNDPPLQSEVVNAIIKNLITKSCRQKVISNLGFDIDLNEGIVSYSVSTPARPFLFGNDVIPLGTLSVIGGLGGSGKSMAMVEMIGAAAIGATYANRK